MCGGVGAQRRVVHTTGATHSARFLLGAPNWSANPSTLIRYTSAPHPSRVAHTVCATRTQRRWILAQWWGPLEWGQIWGPLEWGQCHLRRRQSCWMEWPGVVKTTGTLKGWTRRGRSRKRRWCTRRSSSGNPSFTGGVSSSTMSHIELKNRRILLSNWKIAEFSYRTEKSQNSPIELDNCRILLSLKSLILWIEKWANYEDFKIAEFSEQESRRILAMENRQFQNLPNEQRETNPQIMKRRQQLARKLLKDCTIRLK